MSSLTRQQLIRRSIRLAISGGLFALFSLNVQGSLRWELVERIENYLYDARVRVSTIGGVDERISIVDIDEVSLSREGQWPWPREKLARLVDKLFDQYGARLVAFDAVFAEPEEQSAERVLNVLEERGLLKDAELRAAVNRLRGELDGDLRMSESLIARDVVLGFMFKQFLAPDEPEGTGVLPRAVVANGDLSEFDVPFLEPRGYVGNLRMLQDNAIAAGFLDVPLIDSDGVYRRAPLVQRYRGDLYPTLALAIAHRILGSSDVGFEFAGNVNRSGLALEAFTIGDNRIPVDGRASVLIPFRGPQGSFPYISATQVLNGKAAAGLLTDRIVIVGTSAAGLPDLRPTPVSESYPGVEAQANLVRGLLDQTIRQRPSYSAGLEVAMLLVLALVMALVLPRLPALMSLVFLGATIGAIAGANLLAWFQAGLVIPLASALMFTLAAGLLQISYGYFIESRNKRRLSTFFGRYVPPELVAEMDDQGAEITLEGESREMSVLFSDVRGFTTISERLDARELTQLMNEFLTPMTRVIHDHRGTIDKYMGDAVMAFWGAPLPDCDHARHAVLAGLDMIRAVRELGAVFAARGWPALEVGVGVASGEMNVGNMGSEFRMAYTVLGDTVNLGSRLEGLTKQYGVSMIVSARTAEQVPEVAFRELDLVRVKGKQEPVAIFEPIELKTMISGACETELTQFNSALCHYRRRDWDDAEQALRGLCERADHRLYQVYMERVRRFRRSPPTRDWDGVYVHESK